MTKLKTVFLMLALLSSAVLSHANDVAKTHEDGTPVLIIKTSISASVNGHNLIVVFTENLGQVTIRIFNENGTPIDLMTTPTPNGQIIYIPLAGQYTVLFTLPNGDEYWGEFEVED